MAVAEVRGRWLISARVAFQLSHSNYRPVVRAGDGKVATPHPSPCPLFALLTSPPPPPLTLSSPPAYNNTQEKQLPRCSHQPIPS